MTRILLILALICLPYACSFAETFEHPQYNFKFDAPIEFETVRDPEPNVAVLLKHREFGYPTFNVVLEGGGFVPRAEAAKYQGEEIVREYALVGFTDATLLNSSTIEVSGVPALRANIGYSYQGKELLATVWELSGSSEHLILTFIRGKFDQTAEAWQEKLISSFVTSAPTPTAFKDEAPPPFANVLLISLGFLLLSTMFWYAIGRRNKKS